MACAIQPLTLSAWTWWSRAAGLVVPSPLALALMELLILLMSPPVTGSPKMGAVRTTIETAGEPRSDTWASGVRRTAVGEQAAALVNGTKACVDGRPSRGFTYTGGHRLSASAGRRRGDMAKDLQPVSAGVM